MNTTEVSNMELKLRAAMQEELDHQIIHYIRGEGATKAVMSVVPGKKGIAVIASSLARYEGCSFIRIGPERDYSQFIYNQLSGTNIKTVIIDGIAPHHRLNIIPILKEMGMKIIEFKGIRYNERFKQYEVQCEKLEVQ